MDDRTVDHRGRRRAGLSRSIVACAQSRLLESTVPHAAGSRRACLREDLQRLLERGLGPEAKDAIMTAGQRLIEQGRQQGIEQGRQQGIQAMLLRLLRRRFGDAVNAQVEQRITTAAPEQIEVWAERVLSAATLAD
jgi:hypothetical protein